MAGIQQIIPDDDTRPVVLVGGGGHALSLTRAGSSLPVCGYTDSQPSPEMPTAWLGQDSVLLDDPQAPATRRIHIAVVGIGAEALARRARIIDRFAAFDAAAIIADDAVVTPGSEIAPGCAVMHRAVVNDARIGAHTVVNTGAVVEHGCVIGANVFIGPGAIVCGQTVIGDGCFIGAGASIANGVTIPAGTTVGIGATVVHSIETPGLYVGTPARLAGTPVEETPVIVIAEAGVNHDGSLVDALAMVHAAADAGADYVKFQTFRAASLVTATAPRAEYQEANCSDSATQLQMLERLELSADDFATIAAECAAAGIGFMSTPFDLESVDLLASLGMDYWKVPSGEITNLPLLEKTGSLRGRVILSTGMSTLDEVEAAVAALEKSGTPRADIILLHCTTEYPTPPEDVNLRAMDTLRALGCGGVGYSDHTRGIDVPVAAAARGAVVIEKHFTLSRNRRGPDHKASLEPDELRRMVEAVRTVSRALGSPEKRVAPSESSNRTVARKSIVASRDIAEGEMFDSSNLTVKRPGGGISPMQWHSLTGKTASRAYHPDEPIDPTELTR